MSALGNTIANAYDPLGKRIGVRVDFLAANR